MRLLRGLHNKGISEQGCVATIGNFDGVHLGHQAIIRQVVKCAKKLDLPSVAIIFEPQPLEFFNPDSAPARLLRFREKFQALELSGLDYVFCLKFDEHLSQLTAEAFIDKVLVSHLKLKHLVVGDDFRFGGDRQGDFKLLREQGKGKGFSVENTPTLFDTENRQEDEGYGKPGNAKTVRSPKRVSSTLIRELLAKAQFDQVKTLLGREYAMTGRVVHGKKLGRTLGFPTANVALHRLSAPLTGVFAVRLKDARNVVHQGMANIGVKPTVGVFKPLLEVHLFDFDSDLYGQHVSVLFEHKIRDEQKFESLDALKQQIDRDRLEALAFFGQRD